MIVIAQAFPVMIVGALTINEIMYDPQGSDTGREWIEIFNESANSLDLTSYKFFEANIHHGMVAFQGGYVISPGGYAIISETPSKFLIDYPAYNGIILDSSFSLSNTGEYIAIEDGSKNVIDSVTYAPSIGGGDDGTTLSLIGSSWGKSNSTPGEVNVVATSSTSTPIITTIAKTSSPFVDLTMVVPEEKTVVAGAPADFSVRGLTSQDTSPAGLVYNWSFGDGGESKGRSVAYRYHYPGMYIATVEGDNGFISALGKMRVRVVAPDVSIKNVIKESDVIGIDLENKTPYELDVSGWKIAVNGMGYPLPRNTFIRSKAVTRISGQALFIGTSTLPSTTTLMFPDGMILVPSQFFGFSTSSEEETTGKVTEKKEVYNAPIKKPFVPLVKSTPQPILVAVSSASTSVEALKPVVRKDSRIATFLKSFFKN